MFIILQLLGRALTWARGSGRNILGGFHGTNDAKSVGVSARAFAMAAATKGPGSKECSLGLLEH